MLGLALLASPLIDRMLARYVDFPAGWLRLRVIMAVLLGGMTLIIAANTIEPAAIKPARFRLRLDGFRRAAGCIRSAARYRSDSG